MRFVSKRGYDEERARRAKAVNAYAAGIATRFIIAEAGCSGKRLREWVEEAGITPRSECFPVHRLSYSRSPPGFRAMTDDEINAPGSGAWSLERLVAMWEAKNGGS